MANFADGCLLISLIKPTQNIDPSKTLVDLLKVDLTGVLASGARVLGCKAAELGPSPY